MAKSEDIDLYSPLPPDDIARKLKAVMDDPMTTATARVYGSGSQYDMTLRYARRNVQNPMARRSKRRWSRRARARGSPARSA